MYCYLIVYNWYTSQGRVGTDNQELQTELPIAQFTTVREIEKAIAQEMRYQKVTIINIVSLNAE
jgi:hypothetical protein